jgi:hypothetical protein
MSLDEIKKLIDEDISFHHRPTDKEQDKTIIGLYRRAYFEYREHRNIINKAYLQGVKDTAIAVLGTTRFNTIKRKIEREYIQNKIR